MDCFELCAFRTPQEGAADALRLILGAGMPVNIRVGELREDSGDFDPYAGLLHLVCTYANPETTELAVQFIDILLEYGANWMLLDGHNRTPGDIAYDLQKPELYAKLVRAGVTSEIVLQKLLEDNDDSEDEEEQQQQLGFTDTQSNPVEGTQSVFLKNQLEFDNHTLQTSEQDGVMMDWETPIMKRSAELITREGSAVLNIGFGMGIIDTFIQELKPRTHYIVEAHPQVLAKMREWGWYEKPGVVILEGTWKQQLPKLLDQGIQFDGIYYDTFSEHYKDMLLLFDRIVGLLSFDGVFSYFNGLGADRQICYDVYKQVAMFNLKDYGLQVEFEEIPVNVEQSTWDGIKREYFKLKSYALPKVTFAEALEEEEGEFVIEEPAAKKHRSE